MTVTNSPRTQAYDDLIQLVHSLRPEWQTPGIKAAVRQICTDDNRLVTFQALAAAATAAALTPDLRTPAAIAFDGPHWPKDSDQTPSLPAGWRGPRPRDDTGTVRNPECGAGPHEGPWCDKPWGHTGNHFRNSNLAGYPWDGLCSTCHHPQDVCERHAQGTHEFSSPWSRHMDELYAADGHAPTPPPTSPDSGR